MAAKKTKKTTAKPAPTEAPTPQAIADEVLAKAASAAQAASAELIKEKVTYEDEGAGKEALRTSVAANESAQEDYLPGTRQRDLLALPEYVYDDDRGIRRRVTRPKEYHYCWVEGSDITSFKLMGYRLCVYSGGRGLEEGGFSGTYLYECDQSGHVKLGDVYLMYCPIRLYEALNQEDRQAADRLSRIGETNFHNMGYRYGIRTFSEIDGVPGEPGSGRQISN